jgi:hypothetical protein
MSVTRVFRRRPSAARAIANSETAMLTSPLLRPDATGDLGFDAKQLFVSRYPIIKKALECHRSQGVLIVAFDEGKHALGQAWVAATLDRTRAITIGRHSMCGIRISESNGAVSLRHIVVLVRAISHSEVRIRVLDLHTQIGFSDESGRVLQAATCEGSLFLSVAGVKLMMIVTDDGEISDDARAQYATIPERVFLEEKQGTVGDPVHIGRLAHLPPSVSYVCSAPGPIAAAGNLVGQDEQPHGTLIVRASGLATRKPVGASILERGLLIGRYARCDVGVSFDDDSRLSRVHLLLVKDGGDLLAIDTASVNGTLVEGRSIIQHRVEDGTVFDLGGELGLTWHFEQ